MMPPYWRLGRTEDYESSVPLGSPVRSDRTGGRRRWIAVTSFWVH
jgi:hypothetical protein